MVLYCPTIFLSDEDPYKLLLSAKPSTISSFFSGYGITPHINKIALVHFENAPVNYLSSHLCSEATKLNLRPIVVKD